MVDISFFKCPFCGSECSVKDGINRDGTPRYSSILCSCSITIYYYDNCVWVVITKEEYLEYKQQRGVQTGKG